MKQRYNKFGEDLDVREFSDRARWFRFTSEWWESSFWYGRRGI
jgi:hypothetical protein